MQAHLRPIRYLLAAACAGLAIAARADLVIPGADGSDGAFSPAANQTVDLALAPTAAWDAPGTGTGVYDANQWAVVFKYHSVTIPANVTVKFANHPSRAPVVWLVDGDVTINGTLDLSGENGKWEGGHTTEPGPGGFRGGTGHLTSWAFGGGGYGIGGGAQSGQYDAKDGSYASAGWRNTFPLYGNVRVLPLIGGSGGGGRWNEGISGGAGGGAILIATTGSLTVNGKIVARGGERIDDSGAGSAGAIRLVADRLAGTGTLQASGPMASNCQRCGEGRIRLETLGISGTLSTAPPAEIVAPDDPVILWPPSSVPSARVVSIANATVPADPRSNLEMGQTDVSIPNLSTAQVRVETHNIQPSGTVRVRVSPKNGEPAFFPATFSSGNQAQATWTANVTLTQGYCAIQALAENPAP